MKRLVLILCALLLVGAGCGSSKKAESTVPLPTVLPPATTPDEWAQRVVDRFLRPLNKDLQIVNGFNDPNVIVYLANQNPTTLRIVNKRLADLAQCSDKLVAIGPPPAGNPKLDRVNRSFTEACKNYDELAKQLEKGTLFLSSGRSDVISEGRKIIRGTAQVGNAAAKNYVAGVKVAQKLPEFRRAGLEPSI